MNSLHNFDRSLDKFLAWLSEAESSMECVEAETDRLGGRRDPGLLRQPLHQLKVRNKICLNYFGLSGTYYMLNFKYCADYYVVR